MIAIQLVLVSLCLLQSSSIRGAVLDGSKHNLNAIVGSTNGLREFLQSEFDVDNVKSMSVESTNDNELVPLIRSGHEQTELEFRHPISGVNIDYARNVIVLKFRKGKPKMNMQLDPVEEEKLKALENNFMRFGKRQAESPPPMNSNDRVYRELEPRARSERSHEGMRDSRGDNFMRFGRTSDDFMRFGRSQADFMRFGRNPSDYMRFGRSSGDFMRFGRSPGDFLRFGRDPADFMRLGRNDGNDNAMRFGRNPGDFIRFGRGNKQDFMRFGRSQKANKNFMRFGRPDNFMRFGRTPPESTGDNSANFMRFGKANENFMRFGKSLNQNKKLNYTKPLLMEKNDLKEAVKLLHQSEEKNADESNPMDKAINVLFNKQQEQQQQQQQEQQQQEQQMPQDIDGGGTNDELSAEQDYVLNFTK